MRHVADLVADVVKLLCTKESDLATGGLTESGESAEQSGLSSAIVTQDGVELSAGECGGDAAQRGETAKLLDQVGDGDDGRSFSHRLRDNWVSRWNWSSDSGSRTCQAGQSEWLPVGRVAAHISMRTWLEVVWRGRHRRVRSCR